MEVLIEEFRSPYQWQQHPAGLARKFATSIGPRRLINISSMLSEDQLIIYVWYWSEEPSDLDPHRWKET